MPSLNRVQIIGYLGRDPEVRFTPKGAQYTRFTVATNRLWTSPEGERHTDTEWFTVDAWGRQGELAQQYLHKGRLVYVEGELRTDRWEDEKGQPRSAIRIHASTLRFLDNKVEEPAEVDSE